MTSKREATEKEKASLTKAAREAVNLSTSLPVPALPAAEGLAIGITQQLDNVFFPFEGSGSEVVNTATNIALGPVIGLWRAFTQEKWDSSQTIRANCQAARSNIKTRSGQVNRTIIGTQRDVSVMDETASNIASQEFVNDVQKRAEECRKDPLKCATEGIADPLANIWEKLWKQIPTSAKLVGGAALLGMFLFYVGPLIRAGGNVAMKLTGKRSKAKNKK